MYGPPPRTAPGAPSAASSSTAAGASNTGTAAMNPQGNASGSPGAAHGAGPGYPAHAHAARSPGAMGANPSEAHFRARAAGRDESDPALHRASVRRDAGQQFASPSSPARPRTPPAQYRPSMPWDAPPQAPLSAPATAPRLPPSQSAASGGGPAHWDGNAGASGKPAWAPQHGRLPSWSSRGGHSSPPPLHHVPRSYGGHEAAQSERADHAAWDAAAQAGSAPGGRMGSRRRSESPAASGAPHLRDAATVPPRGDPMSMSSILGPSGGSERPSALSRAERERERESRAAESDGRRRYEESGAGLPGSTAAGTKDQLASQTQHLGKAAPGSQQAPPSEAAANLARRKWSGPLAEEAAQHAAAWRAQEMGRFGGGHARTHSGDSRIPSFGSPSFGGAAPLPGVPGPGAVGRFPAGRKTPGNGNSRAPSPAPDRQHPAAAASMSSQKRKREEPFEGAASRPADGPGSYSADDAMYGSASAAQRLDPRSGAAPPAHLGRPANSGLPTAAHAAQPGGPYHGVPLAGASPDAQGHRAGAQTGGARSHQFDRREAEQYLDSAPAALQPPLAKQHPGQQAPAAVGSDGLPGSRAGAGSMPAPPPAASAAAKRSGASSRQKKAGSSVPPVGAQLGQPGPNNASHKRLKAEQDGGLVHQPHLPHPQAPQATLPQAHLFSPSHAQQHSAHAASQAPSQQHQQPAQQHHQQQHSYALAAQAQAHMQAQAQAQAAYVRAAAAGAPGKSYDSAEFAPASASARTPILGPAPGLAPPSAAVRQTDPQEKSVPARDFDAGPRVDSEAVWEYLERCETTARAPGGADAPALKHGALHDVLLEVGKENERQSKPAAGDASTDLGPTPRPARHLGSWRYDASIDPLLPGEILTDNIGATLEVRISGEWLGPGPAASELLGSAADRLRPREDALDARGSEGPSSATAGKGRWSLGWRGLEHARMVAADRPRGARTKLSSVSAAAPSSPLSEEEATAAVKAFWTQAALVRRKLWGTDVYTDDSDVVAMCAHAGWIEGPAVDDVPGWVPPGRALWTWKQMHDPKAALPAVSSQAERDTRATSAPASRLHAPVLGGGRERTCDLSVTLRVAPRLIAYKGSQRAGVKSRSWGNTHDGVSLVVESVELKPPGYAADDHGLRGAKRRIEHLAKLSAARTHATHDAATDAELSGAAFRCMPLAPATDQTARRFWDTLPPRISTQS